MHYSGVLRQILTPDTSDMQTVHFFYCATMRPYRSGCSYFDYEMHPLSLSTCVLGSSLRLTWPLKCYLSCLSSSASKIIIDLEKSSLCHPYLSGGMAKKTGSHIQIRDVVSENLTIGKFLIKECSVQKHPKGIFTLQDII